MILINCEKEHHIKLLCRNILQLRISTSLHIDCIQNRLNKDSALPIMDVLRKANKFLSKYGFGMPTKDDSYYWKQVGKALLLTYTVFGAAWLWNETSPLGWWTLKPRPKEEKELAHLYERRRFPYPGDTEAVEEFIKSGGTIGTVISPKGYIEVGVDAENINKQLQSKKLEQEAQKLWFRMRNEVISELQEKGFDVE